MEKNVEELAAREYPILLHKDKEGDYIAEIPDLPGCMTDAKSKEEALTQIEDAKRTWITLALEKGVEVPAPRDLDEEPSGKLLLRLPKSLHRDLRWEADREGVSLNHTAVFLLMKALAVRSLEKAREDTTRFIVNTVFFPMEPVTPKVRLLGGLVDLGIGAQEPTATFGSGVLERVRCSRDKWSEFIFSGQDERADIGNSINSLVWKSRGAASGSGGQR